MERKPVIWIVIMALMILAAAAYVLHDNRGTFYGSSDKSSDRFVLDFTKMDEQDSHTLTLQEGDRLSVDFAIERGSADLSIGMEGEKEIYRGNDMTSGIFEVTAPKAGDYRITVSAKQASGYVHIYAMREAE